VRPGPAIGSRRAGDQRLEPSVPQWRIWKWRIIGRGPAWPRPGSPESLMQFCPFHPDDRAAPGLNIACPERSASSSVLDRRRGLPRRAAFVRTTGLLRATCNRRLDERCIADPLASSILFIAPLRIAGVGRVAAHESRRLRPWRRADTERRMCSRTRVALSSNYHCSGFAEAIGRRSDVVQDITRVRSAMCCGNSRPAGATPRATGAGFEWARS